MNPTLEHLRDYWGSWINPQGATEAEIISFEKRYGVALPPGVRDYFALLNGTAAGQCGMADADEISFWHLDEVRSLAEERPDDETPDAGRFFVFADYLIWSHAWAVHLSDDVSAPTPVVITYYQGQQVAGSFEEFLPRYIARDYGVLFPNVDPSFHWRPS